MFSRKHNPNTALLLRYAVCFFLGGLVGLIPYLVFVIELCKGLSPSSFFTFFSHCHLFKREKWTLPYWRVLEENHKVFLIILPGFFLLLFCIIFSFGFETSYLQFLSTDPSRSVRYVWDNFELLLPITEEWMKFSRFSSRNYYWSFMARPGRPKITLKSVYRIICFHLHSLYSQSVECLLFGPNCLVLNWSPDISHVF